LSEMIVEYILSVYNLGELILGFNRSEAFAILNELERIEKIETSVFRRNSLIYIPLKIKKGGRGIIKKFDKGSLIYDIPLNSLVIPLEDYTPSEPVYQEVGKVLEGFEKLSNINRVTKATLFKRV